MIGVTFGSKHSYTDYSLILNNKEIETPETKTESIDIPGADGVLDFTEFFGGVKYNNRKLTFNFTCIGGRSAIQTVLSTIKNALHGKKMNIVLDEDQNFYYVGRLFVGTPGEGKGYSTVKIVADCEPYKYKSTETIISRVVGGELELELQNLRMPVVPRITASSAVTLTWAGGTASIPAATEFIIPELVLLEGKTNITISGNATISIKYREGGL